MKNNSAVLSVGQTLVLASTQLTVSQSVSPTFQGNLESSPISVPDFLAEMESYNFEGNFPDDGESYRGTDSN